MKKIVSSVLALMLCLAALSGCGGSKEVNLEEVMNKINSEYNLSLQSLSSAEELDKYYSISTADVKQFAAEIDSNNDAPVEIILIEATDSTAADNVEKALTARYNSIISIYSSYTPDKLDMVKACKVTKDGSYISMIIADNADGMLKIYNESIK